MKTIVNGFCFNGCPLVLAGLLSLVGCTASEPVERVDAPPQPSEAAVVEAGSKPDPPPAATVTTPADAQPDRKIVFKDEVETNVEIPQGLDGLVFLDTDGKRVALKNYVGKKNVVLVFTEGFTGMLCPFCKTQTSRLVANYDAFEGLDTEVLVVYPGTRD
ncbi:MAG: redoxin domain-containing protein, partial [Pirellulales bacterium]|nr:redoxin domain-containing protein [Pirellulales bacterium]